MSSTPDEPTAVYVSDAQALRVMSLSFLNELCAASARQTLGPDADETDVRVRAELIFAFMSGGLEFPSLAFH